MDAGLIEQLVQREIDEYRYEVPDNSIGNPWSPEKVQRQLANLRDAVVPPRAQKIQLRDTFDQINAANPITVEYWVVADDGNRNLVCFDPDTNEFVLAQRSEDGYIATVGVRGDLVGVFMAR